jgi:hypothetical protein
MEYLGTRLRVAGVDEMGKIFLKKVPEAIYEYSQGYPRVINILADNVLLLSFSKNERKIRPESVKQCYDDMKLEGSFLAKNQTNGKQRESQKVVEIKSRSPKRWMVLILFLVLGVAGYLVGFEISDQGRAFMSQIETYLPENAQAWLVPQVREKEADIARSEELSLNLIPVEREVLVVDPPQPKVELPQAKVESVHKEEAAEKATPEKVAVEKPALGKATVEKTAVAAVDNSSETQPRKEKAAETAIKTVVSISPEKAEPAIKEQSLGFITVKAGDTLIGLALKHYGRADGMILELLQERNPEINNINRIEIGQRIYFPFLPAIKEEGRTFTVHIASFKPFENAQALFQRFMQEGYEAYLMPAYNPEKGKVHRITLGSFKTRHEGDAFAADILKKGIVGYAETILLEAR